ncbi:glutathione S-transferase family protein [Caldimonas brevitalea]|uniref:Glutathione S-transferase n=1 Tax=Caldimonas brevitalea TaxID=413882 RepID=A0A0G3BRZ7_9BURK|nr:glutathione S-transferase [Caldimonas brevitalea]AKJ32202.1 glutathione S-transferase [Caldimonas brevitalea]
MNPNGTHPLPSQPLRLYRHELSGHAHRVELLLSLLGLPFERVDVDLRRREHKQPAFLEKNPFGQVPVIEDGELTLADSNAILVYLATRYDGSGRWWPRDPVGAANVQRWLSVAAGALVNGPGNARLAVLFRQQGDPQAQELAHVLLERLEAHLGTREYFAADHPTVADVALYSYTAHAPEGGVSLQPYARLRAWLQRIEALPGFVPMQRSPTLA